MRVRCPKDGVPFDVPDDMVGMHVQCPHCGHRIPVTHEDRHTSSEQIQAETPIPKPSVSSDIENSIYDGLPPLSVMMALRRGKGPSYDDDELARRYPMTDDDWKALSAFETVLRAVASMRVSLILLGISVGFNGLFLIFLLNHSSGPDGELSPLAIVFIANVLLVGCGAMLYMGRHRLARIRSGIAVTMSVVAAFGVIAILGLECAWILNQIFGGRYHVGLPPGALIGVAIFAIATFDAARTASRMWEARSKIAPPEITSRLVDALTYLDDAIDRSSIM